jgi:hypothetical protein
MTKVTTNFSDQTIYVGLDVHKRSWNAALYLNDQYLRNVHQQPDHIELYDKRNGVITQGITEHQ